MNKPTIYRSACPYCGAVVSTAPRVRNAHTASVGCRMAARRAVARVLTRAAAPVAAPSYAYRGRW
jgi:tRNA A37 threonylcarbamoyladenosine synthetase subunit TsaC/SUA5/YrdC